MNFGWPSMAQHSYQISLKSIQGLKCIYITDKVSVLLGCGVESQGD